MNHKLRKWNINACAIQSFLNRNNNICPSREIVSCLYLTAGVNANTGVSHFRYIYGYLFFVLNIGILISSSRIKCRQLLKSES